MHQVRDKLFRFRCDKKTNGKRSELNDSAIDAFDLLSETIEEAITYDTYELQWQVKKSEMEKDRDMEGEGKGEEHQHGRKSRIPEALPIAWKLPSEEVWKHWTPTGCGLQDI